jgi:hypothetical protein
MYSYSTSSARAGANAALPKEYREIAERLFPSTESSAGWLFPPTESDAGWVSDIEAAKQFADLLGVGADYMRLWTAPEYEHSILIKQLLEHFQNNISLLIQKTWVEQADEDRKEKLQECIPGFITLIEQSEYQKALTEFGNILGELAHLFFGAQSKKDDFTEYVFRIDDQIGLFWWYGSQIAKLHRRITHIDVRTLRAILLIGLCYLANF